MSPVLAFQAYHIKKLVPNLCQSRFAPKSDFWHLCHDCMIDFIKSRLHLCFLCYSFIGIFLSDWNLEQQFEGISESFTLISTQWNFTDNLFLMHHCSKILTSTLSTANKLKVTTFEHIFFPCRDFACLRSQGQQEGMEARLQSLHQIPAPPADAPEAHTPPWSSRSWSWNSNKRTFCWQWSVATNTGSLEKMQR